MSFADFRFPVAGHGLAIAVAVLLSGCENESSTKPKAQPPRPADAAVTQEEPVAKAPVAEEPVAKEPAAKKPTGTRISDEAFRMAAYEGRTSDVEKAIEAGSDVNAVDARQSLTALHMAAYNGHSHTVKLLLNSGATVDCRDSEGKTPLIHACTGPFAETVEILLDAGAEINAKDSTESFTPLMMAAGLGQAEVVKVLLGHQADKSIVDDDNDSALDHAQNSGHTEIVQLLK